ncbi:Propeptide PepSY amd peptidase M4 [Parvibaculum lavamentivorans DS-1]|uniref:Propeptide PepSY amd peptidase M4 n=1 Tax=Parvibaculum lavamentivorans (strain DS-1 / DSM 13023 / NCIMB 13966) TaxID=402881 RepID=A7HRL7_PARL1|nr:PepSY domain-containing protein [Parvibaculum lavamentivorans]ABS62550.1 Propeptide PepSY amd peptidase M4 [Parvibaculum lavamentivorans DS-1]
MTQKRTWIALTIAAAALFFIGQSPGHAATLVPAPGTNELLQEAQWHRSEQDSARDAVRSGQVISPGQAKQAALSRYPGRFLDMSFGGNAYYVKIMTADSRVVVVTVDAASGRVTGAR